MENYKDTSSLSLTNLWIPGLVIVVLFFFLTGGYEGIQKKYEIAQWMRTVQWQFLLRPVGDTVVGKWVLLFSCGFIWKGNIMMKTPLCFLTARM